METRKHWSNSQSCAKIGKLVISGEYSFSLMGCSSSPQFEGTGTLVWANQSVAQLHGYPWPVIFWLFRTSLLPSNHKDVTAFTELMNSVSGITKISQVRGCLHVGTGRGKAFSWSFSPPSALGCLWQFLCLYKKQGYILRCTWEWGRSQTEQERLVTLKESLDFLNRTAGNTENLRHHFYRACRGADEFAVEGGK